MLFLGSGNCIRVSARLAQLVERKTLNLVVVGSSPTVGTFFSVYVYRSGVISILGGR